MSSTMEATVPARVTPTQTIQSRRELLEKSGRVFLEFDFFFLGSILFTTYNVAEFISNYEDADGAPIWGCSGAAFVLAKKNLAWRMNHANVAIHKPPIATGSTRSSQ